MRRVVVMTTNQHGQKRLGSDWPARVIEETTSYFGDDRRVMRQVSFGVALAAATSNLAAHTNRLLQLSGDLPVKVAEGDHSSVLNISLVLKEGVEELASLYEDLQNYACCVPVRTQVVDTLEIFDLVNKSARLVEGDITFAAELLCEACIRVNVHHLEQMVCSLMKNAESALNALPSSVTRERCLTVWIHPLVREDDRRYLGDSQDGLGYLGISVYDTGVGMTEDVFKRVAEPYFTTRESWKGTGLGLFVTRNLVDANNGHLVMRTRAGEGTLVTLCFPLVTKT